MNEKVYRVLEYEKIISRLVEKASSESGKQMCRDLKPSTNLKWIQESLQETDDTVKRIFQKGSILFQKNKNIAGLCKSLEIGCTLTTLELLQIADSLECALKCKNYGRSEREEEEGDSLTPYFETLAPNSPLANEIRRCILDEDLIADDASANLKRIRRSMTITNERIRSHLQNLINGPARTYLQDAVVTTRDGRFCIPVKAEHKKQIKGMVHDSSATGSTFFIEPAAVVDMNNELRELAREEVKEIEVILANLSAEAGEHTAEMLQNYKVMTKLDFLFAKANLAIEQKASKPLFNEERYINIRKGRHPLLDPKKVVPIDINLGKEFDLLVVTGPNTGGKTVSLKTVGLLTLMGQAGMFIPAADRSELTVFREVYADIGDEQSIEQSLSTFSSHITNIVSFLSHADEKTLCLFDELCAGTDPTEGSALAIAILNYLHERGVCTMATTHYSELKVYALSTPFVENACCEFDVATLRPTYRLLIGIPGKSNAFAISSKLGIPEDIIEKAKEQITEENESFEDLLANLEARRLDMEKRQLEMEETKAEIDKLKAQLAEKEAGLAASKDKILREANEEARRILAEAKEVADETIRYFQKNAQGVSMKEMEKSRQKVRDHIGKKNESLAIKVDNSAKTIKASQIKLGDPVRVVSMGLKGTVTSLPDARGDLFVQCGIIKSKVNLKDLALMEEPAQTAGKAKTSKVSKGGGSFGKAAYISPEINLLGRTVDEAIAELDKYLDDAYLSHLSSVRIVHGKGTGALRSAVQSHLKRVKYVKTFRSGEYGEGDAGVTIAEFK